MNATVNRQILLVEKPTGKLAPEHFKMVEGAIPEPKDGEVLVRTRYISLDAANRAWMHGATYRAAVEANTVMAGGGIAEVVSSKAPGLSARRYRVRRYRLAGLCGGAGKASDQDAEDGADDASAQRLRHRRPHRLFRAAPCRQAQGGRDRRGLGRGRFGRLDRRPDRKDQGMPCRRHRRRQGQVQLADHANSASTPRSTTRTARPSRRCARPRPRASTSISTMSAATFWKPASRR